MSAETGAPGTPATTAPSVSAPEASFTGRRGPLFWLLLRNLLLTIVTIGIYRFWAKTRVRRFFWRHVRLLGDPLEYLGTGGELFVGFLIAIVILAPLGAGYSLLQFFMLGNGGYMSFAVDIVYYTVIAFLVQVAIHRMRRYRLTRTAWRGVRFGLDGSSLTYAGISFGYGLLTFVTLGLARPWLRVATMKYFLNHARFGNVALTLEASGAWLFRRWVFVALPLAAAIVLLAVINWPLLEEFAALNERAAAGEEVSGEIGVVMAQVDYWPLTIIVLTSVISVWYYVVEFRYLVANLRIGKTSFASAITPAFVYRVYFVFWFVVFLATGTVLAAFVGNAALVYSLGQSANLGLAALMPVLAVLVFFTLYGILRTLLVDVTLLKRVCATLSIENAADLETVIQSSADMPGHGEGLADALDVGGF